MPMEIDKRDSCSESRAQVGRRLRRRVQVAFKELFQTFGCDVGDPEQRPGGEMYGAARKKMDVIPPRAQALGPGSSCR